MKRTRTIDCLVQFNEVELRMLTGEVTRLFWKRAHLEEEKKETAKAFSDQIADLSMEISEHMEALRLGGRMQPVVCVEEFNTPEPGKKTITRTDTGAVIAEKEMSLDEINDMFVQNGDDEIPEGTEEAKEAEEAEECPFDLEKDTIDILSIDREKDDPIPGCMYRLQDKVYLCLTDHNACENCSIFGCGDSPFCDFCSMDKIFKEVHPAAAPGGAEGDDPEAEDLTPPVKSPQEQDPENWESDSMTREELAEREAVAEAAGIELCDKCHVGGKLYHVNNGKTVCYDCMLRMPQEKRVKEMLDAGHAFLFRAAAGYGNVEKNCDSTNFRFIDKSPEAAPDEPWRTNSWGMGIWRPGDYREEGTPANEFYKVLQMNPNGREG